MARILLLLAIIKASAPTVERLFSIEEKEGYNDPPPLINLGNSLKDRLTSMACPFDKLLYKDIHKYYNLLSDVYRFLKKRDAAEIVKGWRVYSVLEQTGGPPHINMTLDFSKFKRRFKWTQSGEIKDVKEIFWLTRELWEDIQDRAAHLRTGEPDPPPVETSTIDWTPFIREVSSGSGDSKEPDYGHY